MRHVERRTLEPGRPERVPPILPVFRVHVFAVAGEEPVLRVDLLIQPQRHLIGVELRDRVRHVRVARRIRQRDVLQEELRLRRNAIRRNLIVRKLRARRDAPDGRRGQRIENRREAAEISLALRRGRHDADVDDALLPPVSLVAREEERLVPSVVHPGNHHRTAERAAELIALELLFVHGEKVLRVERVVAHELEHASVERVAARLGRHVERGAGAVEFGRVRVLLTR